MKAVIVLVTTIPLCLCADMGGYNRYRSLLQSRQESHTRLVAGIDAGSIVEERHEELEVKDLGTVSYESLFKDNILTGTPFIASGMGESVVFEGVGGHSDMVPIYDACLDKASAGNTKVRRL